MSEILKIVQFLEALETFIDDDKQMQNILISPYH